MHNDARATCHDAGMMLAYDAATLYACIGRAWLASGCCYLTWHELVAVAAGVVVARDSQLS